MTASDAALEALSPLDGRYRSKLSTLSNTFSEAALIKHRLLVEIAWLKALSANPGICELQLSESAIQTLDGLLADFSTADAKAVKAFERQTNHDVKAVEYFLRERMQPHDELSKATAFIHFALTSEDVNNLSYALMLKEALSTALLPGVTACIDQLKDMANNYKDAAMLSHTHGQPASPTTLGKELSNFAHRLSRQLGQWQALPILAKCNGAVGNFNAHVVAYPDVDWIALSTDFIQSLGLTPNLHTTQIEPHDNLAEHLHVLTRINNIVLDLSRDCWQYISLHYFTLKKINNEVGSSTMPHKINPIDFENAEGNCGLGTSLALHCANKLTQSRLQRDLSDSTVLRNLGSIFGYSLLAWKSCLKGLQKCEANTAHMEAALANHWELLAEPVQTVMRKHGIEDAYEQLKALSRGKPLDQTTLHAFIDTLTLPDADKNTLKELTPSSYLGVSISLIERSD